MRHLYRIQLPASNTANHAYLVREFRGVPIMARVTSRVWDNGLATAKRDIREQLQAIRTAARKMTRTERAHVVSGLYYSLIGGVFSEAGTIKDFCRNKKQRIRERKLRMLATEKRPFDHRRHVGVEIEFFTSKSAKLVREALADADLEKYCNLTTDGSVSGNSGENDCDGSCRDNCECAQCGERHHCDNESDCNRRARNYGDTRNGARWEYREDCDECDSDTEERDGCNCGDAPTGSDPICDGHNVCGGHCPGHYCMGAEDHPDYDCNCECNCSGNSEGLELRVIAPQTEITDVITRACSVLRECGADVNDTCGLHVHLDMRGRDVAKCYKNLAVMQHFLYRLVPASRKKNTYCKPVNCTDWEHREGDRYQGINHKAFSEHRTLEVRIHSGTVSAKKINHWITLLVAIVRAPQLKAAPRTASGAVERLKLKGETQSYIQERLQKFERQHARLTADAA